MVNDIERHERAIEAVAAKLRSPSTFPGNTATLVAHELVNTYLLAMGTDGTVAQEPVAVKALEDEIMDAIDEYREKLPGDKFGPHVWPTINGVKEAVRKGILSALSPPREPAPQVVDSRQAVFDAARLYVNSVNGGPGSDASTWAWKAYDDKIQTAFDELCAALASSQEGKID